MKKISSHVLFNWTVPVSGRYSLLQFCSEKQNVLPQIQFDHLPFFLTEPRRPASNPVLQTMKNQLLSQNSNLIAECFILQKEKKLLSAL